MTGAPPKPLSIFLVAGEHSDFPPAIALLAFIEDRSGHTFAAGGFGKQVAEGFLAHAVDADQFLLFAQTDRVIGWTTLAALTVLAWWKRALVEIPLNFVRLEQVDPFAAAQFDDWTCVAGHYSILFLRGRQPLCGTGVSSMIDFTSKPEA